MARWPPINETHSYVHIARTMTKLASLKPSTAQTVSAVFSVINAVANLILVALMVTGGIAVRTVYVDTMQGMDAQTVAHAKMMFGDITYFVHEARINYEANDGSLPFNMTAISIATTYAMDGITAALESVNRDAIYNATTTLGEPATQVFIATSVERVLGDVERLQNYVDTLANLLRRIQVNPSSFVALLAPPAKP